MTLLKYPKVLILQNILTDGTANDIKATFILYPEQSSFSFSELMELKKLVNAKDNVTRVCMLFSLLGYVWMKGCDSGIGGKPNDLNSS
jgi:hypothetical protein